MSEQQRDESRRYHHAPDEGETVAPDPGDASPDPHHEANTSLDELPDHAPGQAPQAEGMGNRPPARGERVSGRKLPPEDE
jgi:hypothetical protein